MGVDCGWTGRWGKGVNIGINLFLHCTYDFIRDVCVKIFKYHISCRTGQVRVKINK